MNLSERRKKHRLLALESNVVRLLFLRIVRILNPLKPTIGWNQYPAIRPQLFEKLPSHHSFDTRIDRRRSFALGPKWCPSPAYLVDAQTLCCRANDFDSGGWRNVVSLDRPEVIPADDQLLWRKLLKVAVHGFIDRIASAHDVTRNVTRRKCLPIRLTAREPKS